MKDFVISITKETIINELKSEAEIYLLLSEEIYDEIETGTESYTKEHEFGTDGSLISYIITAIVSMGAKSLVKEGVLLTKIALLDWIKKNEISIKKNFKSKNSNKALEILIKYLSK